MTQAQSLEIFSKAVGAVLSFSGKLGDCSKAPIKQWAGGEELSPGASTMRYPIYREEVGEFFTALVEFLDLWTPKATDYQATSRPFLDNHDAIGTACPDEIKALLTYVCRGEKFCDGFWGETLRSGLVTALLDRLCELNQSAKIEPAE